MDLKFNRMTVDTTLAQEYLQKPKGDLSNPKPIPDNFLSAEISMDDIDKKLSTLAAKIKENLSLLAQLEYVLRKIPIEDSTIQINLIIQQIYYVIEQIQDKNLNRRDSNSVFKRIILSDDTPLLIFGALPKELVLTQICYIDSKSETTDTMCDFITKLCQDIGLEVYTSSFWKTELTQNWPTIEIPSGAIGVVSELSDTDSAADVFLASSTQVPWRLLRILVQESVYEQFKNALIWKCNLNKQRVDKPPSDTSPDSVEYNGRKFFLDTVGSYQPQSSVLIEAYRTRKELKSLLNVHRPHYLSLWANDIAEINEIAYGTNSYVVWVNNYADFRGPSKVSEGIYSHISPKQKFKDTFGISELKASWVALDFEARRQVLIKALDECSSKVPEPENQRYKQIKNDLQKVKEGSNDSFIEIGKDYVCSGLNTRLSKLFYTNTVNHIYTLEFYKSILLGSAFLVQGTHKYSAQVLDILKHFRVPVVSKSGSFSEGDDEVNTDTAWLDRAILDVTQTTKVIWTNSGTIFAN